MSMASLRVPKSTFMRVATVGLLLCFQFALINAHGGHDEDSSDSDAANLHSRSLILVKIWCLLIFFFSTFVFGVSPYFFRWNDSFLLLGTQFAAGIFLGTSLMHFLGDANETFDYLTSVAYPFAYMLACAGYVFTMFADVLITYIAKKSTGETQVLVEEQKTTDVERQEHHQNPYLLRTSSVGDTILLIVALCFHSIFEGIAVGVSATEADAWRNLWTISLHKVFAAISMGLALLKMLPKRPFVATVGYSFAFAISSPVGIGIGIGIDSTTEGRTADWIFAISMSFACGVFIYVSINHLIAKGYKPRSPSYFDTPFFKFLAVFAGVTVMAIVMAWD